MSGLCEHCGKNVATVIVTQIINQNKSELSLCSECAKHFGHPISFFDLLGGMFDYESANYKSANNGVPALKCDKCGLSLNEFRQTSFLGCDNCYAAFKEQLKDICKQMNGDITHKGKMPQKIDAGLKRKYELTRLKNELQLAILNEEYEKCASLRDRIKGLEVMGNA